MKLRFSLIVIALNLAIVAALLLGATEVENIWRYLLAQVLIAKAPTI